MTIKLHKFGEVWRIADPSPFCLKVENFLREANAPYESVPFDPMRTLSKAPKGKLSFIEAEHGTRIGDSTLIIDWLSRKQGIDADAPLGSEQRAVSLAFRRMLDEHLYWVGVYFRWFDEPGWSVIRKAFFSDIPWPVRSMIMMAQKRKFAAALKAQGTGRHSREEICQPGDDDSATSPITSSACRHGFTEAHYKDGIFGRARETAGICASRSASKERLPAHHTFQKMVAILMG